ncbi:MAG: glycine--tRNA ligase subunit beta, partial [Alphaproteobacteria bacterium]|nr:glycine--tRNA ligase subunit beta [Alphaproteobacteria bacterium]MBX9977463.1 glycine--tRNA ligase subunit beta [Alphaproteobacteria bacterium]
RLDDARFFYEHDLKIPLQDLTQKLEIIIFHEKLVTLGDKLRRMHTGASLGVSGGYAHILGIKEPAHLTRAINLCKSDLLTQMVGEFAELQGVMGEIYALKQGESGDVAVALREYYQPNGPSDAVPTRPVSIALALLDKIDTLVGFVGHGILPTGSKDPFALRRAALGVLRIILENRLSLGLLGFLKATANAYLSNHQNLQASVAEDLLAFFHTRFQFFLKDQGFSHDIIQACLPKAGEDLVLVPIANKVAALHSLVETADGKALLAGFKRACNIFDAESRKDGKSTYAFNETLLTEIEEKALFDALTQIEKVWPSTPLDTDQCKLLASLRDPIDAFFEAIMVNDSNPAIRENRLGLLQRIIAFFMTFANFKVME